jgi:hypothetical protein
MKVHASRANGSKYRVDSNKTTERQAILKTLDPDAENQRYYRCDGCYWPCINPVGTLPEELGLCVDCLVDLDERQAQLGEWQ